jgi:hypothetical protein
VFCVRGRVGRDDLPWWHGVGPVKPMVTHPSDRDLDSGQPVEPERREKLLPLSQRDR